MTKKIILCVLSLLMIIVFIGNVLAITGSIGNARMILRAETGDKIEKYILVKNVNDVASDVEVFASGDLEEYIDIKDNEFTLSPGGEKKAYFTIRVKKAGTTETKINVMFKPEQGNGVGLSSTVIVIAKDDGGWFDDDSDEDRKGTEVPLTSQPSSDSGVNVITGKVASNGNPGNKKNPVDLILLLTAFIFLIFIAVVIFAFTKYRGKTKPKKSVNQRG